MKIYGDFLSPFVRMCFVTAHELGLGDKVSHEKELVSPTKPNPKLTALSPIGKVPVLETDHGRAVYDSRVIIEYLCHVAGNSTIIPDDGVKRFRVLTMQALSQGLGESAVGLRYETAARPQGLQWADWIERTTTRMTATFDDLEHHWQAEKAEVNAGSIATAVVLGYIDYRLPQVSWRDGRPELARFYDRFAARDSMKKTVITA
jgi:glutathione S-transferase